MCQFSDKTDNFDFFYPNLLKNGFWGTNFKNISADLESAPPRNHVWQFSTKTGNFEFSTKIWENCPITCNMLVLVMLRVLQRTQWRLKRPGCRWVHGLKIPSNSLITHQEQLYGKKQFCSGGNL